MLFETYKRKPQIMLLTIWEKIRNLHSLIGFDTNLFRFLQLRYRPYTGN